MVTKIRATVLLPHHLPPQKDKVKAAGDMIKKLRSVKPSLVQSVERLCDAYIDLAYHDVTAYTEKRLIKLPSNLGKLTTVAVPTVEIPIDPTCCYDNIITIEEFDSHFELASKSKVISCLSSDGKRRRQLVKVVFLYPCKHMMYHIDHTHFLSRLVMMSVKMLLCSRCLLLLTGC